MITQKEIEKQNFILWYSLYATEKELEMARTHNRKILDRLLQEYAEEVEKVNRTRYLYERIIQSKSMKTQGFDVTLKINYFSYQRKIRFLLKAN
ncbi:MAG: hypothetical protein NG747_10670 [Candidatus Brocadia sp.]|nr:hypothetical protein [Candidatus Brocadia sp.]